MKYLICSVLLIMNSWLALAQSGPAPTDTVKITPAIKPRNYTAVNMVSTQNIIQNLSQAKGYSIFFNALKTAGLTETFSSKGPITIFVPNNGAFSKLPPGTLDTLLKPNHKFELINLVTYYALPGTLLIKDIAKQIDAHKGHVALTTISGGKIIASMDKNHNIVLTDESGRQIVVGKNDIRQLNGVIHIVDSVLMPKYTSI